MLSSLCDPETRDALELDTMLVNPKTGRLYPDEWARRCFTQHHEGPFSGSGDPMTRWA